jgi:hypothetical protein
VSAPSVPERARDRDASSPLGLRGWAVIAVLLGLVTMINIAFIPDLELELSGTSYGRAGNGFGAAYDLLDELGFAVGRSRSRYADVSAERALWLLAPQTAKGLRTWLEGGGTALLIEPSDAALLELGLDLETDLTAVTDEEPSLASGSLGKRPFQLDVSSAFDPDHELESVLEIGGKPFALLGRVGSGHVVLIADAAPFRNGQIDKADHALLVVELVRAFGPPVLDERSHGLVNETTLWAALGAGRFAMICAGLGLLALVVLWSARRLPSAALVPEPRVDSSLGQYVAALAHSYQRKGPRASAEVYRAYVHGLRHRLRKAIYGRRDASDALLSGRLEGELYGEPAVLESIEGRDEPQNASELRRSVQRMESYMARGSWQSRRAFVRSKEP